MNGQAVAKKKTKEEEEEDEIIRELVIFFTEYLLQLPLLSNKKVQDQLRAVRLYPNFLTFNMMNI